NHLNRALSVQSTLSDWWRLQPFTKPTEETNTKPGDRAPRTETF
ncbi:hypothetical protein LINPERHAP2_LOCUS21083, partial [Linum perenne]